MCYFLQGPNDPKVTYTFELTTNSFNVDSDGYVYVNEEKLDRDPPNPGKYRFQVNTNFRRFLSLYITLSS